MKNRYESTDGTIDIETIFDQWLSKLIAIKRLCPYSRIIVSPIPPTKIRSLNDRARKFNHLMFTCLTTSCLPHVARIDSGNS